VPPELLDTAFDVLRLAVLFFTALLLPVMLQVVLLFSMGFAFKKLIYGASTTIATLLSLIGVPLHELFHALGCLLTFSGVAAIKLLIDELGYAFVSPKRSNVVGDIVTSLAPLFGGMLVLWLTATYIIPGFAMPTVEPPQLDLESAASLGAVLRASADYLGHFVRAAYENLPGLQWDSWRTYVGLYIALSVGIGIAPSTTDLKIFLAALPLSALLVLALFTLLYLSGDMESQFVAFQQGLWPYLLKFSTAVTYAFVLTSLGMFIFLPLRLFKAIREG